MGANSIQFRGLQAVVDAYENRKIAAWGVFQGKQFMFSYPGADITEGATELEATLEMLKTGSNAIYTLKVYEDLTGGKIKSNTADDGSFNFRLHADEAGLSGYQGNNQVISQLNAMQEEITALREEKESDQGEEKNPVMGFLNGLLKEPAIANIVTQYITGVLANLTAPAKVSAPQLNGIPDQVAKPAKKSAGLVNVVVPVELATALQILAEKDSQLPAHMASLAKIASEKPDQFALLISMLKNY